MLYKYDLSLHINAGSAFLYIKDGYRAWITATCSGQRERERSVLHNVLIGYRTHIMKVLGA